MERVVSAIGIAAVVACACACAPDAAPPSRDASPRAASAPSAPEPPAFDADWGDAGATASAAPDATGDAGASDAPVDPPVDPAFHARLLQQIRGVVGADYDAYDWNALLHAKTAFNGTRVWIPGTGESVVAMGSVPSGLAAWGAAFDGALPVPGATGWRGLRCAQSDGGSAFAKTNRLSALQVFATAWPDARSYVTSPVSSGAPPLAGAWIVGHSAGALPALLAGLLAGAHRVDAYGVPSAVGYLDGDDGIVHLHTHPLDPAGAMGKLDAGGAAQIDLASAFVTIVQAGGTLAYHDYSSWPAPSP